MVEHTENLDSRKLIWSTKQEEDGMVLLQLWETALWGEETARHNRWSRQEEQDGSGGWESQARDQPSIPPETPARPRPPQAHAGAVQWSRSMKSSPRSPVVTADFKRDFFFQQSVRISHQWQISRMSPKHLRNSIIFFKLSYNQVFDQDQFFFLT